MEIITLAEARDRGLTRFFTGLICKNGHIAERLTSNNGCVECIRSLRPAADSRRREKINASMRVYRQKNNDRMRSADAARYAADPGRFCERMRVRYEDPIKGLVIRVRVLVRDAIEKRGHIKSEATENILGCSMLEFVAHIERQFLPGMTWDNRADWHIDHIVPLATATTEAEVLALNHFTNLRPLWGKDNLSKGAKQTHLI